MTVRNSTPDRSQKRKSFSQKLQISCWKRVRKMQRLMDHPLLFGLIGPMQIFLLRTGERWLGTWILPWLLLPFISWELLMRLPDYPTFKQRRTILPPEFWRDLTPFRHYYLMIRNWQNTLAVGMLSDRLQGTIWSACFQVKGIPPNQMPEWGKRPVILVFLHTGGYGILRHWLRGQGFRAAIYLTFPAAHYRTSRAKKSFADADKNNGLLNVPSMFFVGHNLRGLLNFLRPGHILNIALDGQSASSRIFNVNGFPIHLSTGVIELALLSNALLLPVAVRRPSVGRFHIHFGVPVPDECMDRLNPEPAVQFMLDQLWKSAEEEPHSIGWGILHALSPQLSPPHKPWP